MNNGDIPLFILNYFKLTDNPSSTLQELISKKPEHLLLKSESCCLSLNLFLDILALIDEYVYQLRC